MALKDYRVFAYRKADNASVAFKLRSEDTKTAWTQARARCRAGGTVETLDGESVELQPMSYGVSNVRAIVQPKARKVSAEALIEAMSEAGLDTSEAQSIFDELAAA